MAQTAASGGSAGCVNRDRRQRPLSVDGGAEGREDKEDGG